MRKLLIILFYLVLALPSRAAYLLIPMDNTQTNHLKAYGVAYWVSPLSAHLLRQLV